MKGREIQVCAAENVGLECTAACTPQYVAHAVLVQPDDRDEAAWFVLLM